MTILNKENEGLRNLLKNERSTLEAAQSLFELYPYPSRHQQPAIKWAKSLILSIG
jgi:hypothetical protein